jgi:pimeloyl-ACP methyl ester carboxylesterase
VLAVLVAAGCGSDPPAAEAPDVTRPSADAGAPPRTDAPGTTAARAPSGTTVPDEAFAVAPIDWEPCGSRRECGTLEVPVDHDDPDGATVELAVIRRPATGSDRIGSLVMNPGGPGGSGVDYVSASPLDPTLNEYFDIVGWDPRGVGASEPISCNRSVDAMRRLDWDPDDDGEQADLDAAAEAIADDCADEYGDRLAEVATDDTVSDLDLLRQALGDDQLTYLGFSYGTSIGLQYAERHPDRVRALVLDGVVDPNQDLEELLTGQAVAFEQTLDEAFAACVDAGTCAEDPAETYERVRAAVEAQPLPVAGGEPLGPTDLAYAALSSAYAEERAQSFVAALQAADRGDARALRQLADAYFASTDYSEYAAVVCTDNPHPESAEDYRAMTERMAEAAPRFGAAVASEMLPCAFWGSPVTGEPGPIRAEGAAPILVVGNTGDAATPYESAVQVADDLDSSVLLTYEGSGHTSFNSSECVAEAVRFYVVDLVLPEVGTTCTR